MLLYAKPAHVARPDEKNGTALPQSMTYQLYTYAPKGGKALPHHDIRNHRASCVMGGSGDDFRKDGLATALHVYYINRKYPHAELSLSCPRLRPIVNNDKINPRDVGEKELCQVLCSYRMFLPFVGITVSSRESADFRNGIAKICATKVSAGVSTGIGDHEEKYEGTKDADVGDEQFEINDSRSFESMYQDMEQEGLQPVLNDYLYV